MTITRQEVRANREKWIARLKDPLSRKAIGRLATKDGRCCCLGHGCDALGISYPSYETHSRELMEACGLYDECGETWTLRQIGKWEEFCLIDVNDGTDATPQEIGAYLETVIEGGESTPFRPLSDYPEASS